MIQPTLKTVRLTLRPFAETDIDPLHYILTDPEVMRYWGDVHLERVTTERFVLGTMRAAAENTCDFVIERMGSVIGKAGMWQCPEIGFFVHRDHHGQGIATEALQAIIPHLFSVYTVDTLTADVDPRNAASLAVLAKLGFKQTHRETGTITMHGELCDSVYLALPRSVGQSLGAGGI